MSSDFLFRCPPSGLAIASSLSGTRQTMTTLRFQDEIPFNQWVAVRAVSFGRIFVGKMMWSELREMLFSSYCHKMIRIHASPVFAFVVKLLAFWCRTNKQAISHNVCVNRLAIEKKSATAILFTDARKERPALILTAAINFTHKPINRWNIFHSRIVA